MENMERASANLDDSLEILVAVALDRNDIQQLIKGLPENDGISPVTMEYELQLLKIITVGWGIAYFLENAPEKTVVLEAFWNRINELSKNISAALAPTLGNEFDYFSILKERLDLYVTEMGKAADVSDPGIMVGPLFAKLCGEEAHDYLVVSGKAVFHLSLGDVKKYLESTVIHINAV